MEDKIQFTFDEGVKAYHSGDIEKFCNAIIYIESHIYCDCFYNNQPKHIWEDLISTMMKIKLKNTYYSHVTSAFISLRVEDYRQAKIFLNYALAKDKKNPFLLTLVFQIKEIPLNLIKNGLISFSSEINIKKIPRLSYFYIKKCLELIEKRDEIIWRNEILNHCKNEISEIGTIRQFDFCFYSLKGLIHFELGEFELAIFSLESNIKYTNNPMDYFILSLSKLNLNDYSNAYKYANLGLSKFNNYSDFYYILGLLDNAQSNHKNAISNFSTYLKICTNSRYLKHAKELYNTNKDWFNFYKLKNEMSKYYVMREFETVISLYKNSKLRISDFKSCYTFENNEYINKFKYGFFYMYLDSLNYIHGNQYLVEKSKLEFIDSAIRNYVNLEQRRFIYLNLGVSNLMPFGKYKSKPIIEVINYEPDYLIWCICEVEIFSLRNSVLLEPQLQCSIRYYEAVKINLFKNDILPRIEKEIDEENSNERDSWYRYDD